MKKWLVLVVLLIILINSAFASPYGPQNKTTVYDRLYEADLVIYGKIIQKVKSKTQGDLTEIQVYDNIKGGKWEKGDYFYVNSIIKKPNKSVGIIYLYLASKEGHQFYEFGAFYNDKNKDMYKYTKKIKEFMDNKDEEGRLRWLFSQVDSKNKLIAWDAFAQLGMAPYHSLKKVASSINRESLRYLIVMPKISPSRKSFYVFLLGLAKNPKDLPFIKRIIEKKENQNSKIMYGSMMAYGLISKDRDNFFYKKIKSKAPDNVKMAIIEAIKNIMIYERPPNPQKLLRPIYWTLKHGNKKLTLKAVQSCAEMRITGAVKYMKGIYFGKFKNFKKGKIAVINYLKFVRKKTPNAVKVLKEIKKQEKNPQIKYLLEI